MATDKRLGYDNVDVETGFINGDVDDITELQDDLDSRVQFAYNELGADPNDDTIYFKAYKEEQGKPKPSFLFDFNISEMPVNKRLIDDYGTGDYIVNMVRNKKLFRKFNVRVLAPGPKAQISNNSPDLTGLMETIFKEQRQQQKAFQDLLLTLTMRSQQPVVDSQPPATDPTALMMGMMGMMIKMKEFLGPPPQDNGMHALDHVLKGIELAKELQGPGGGGESNLTDLLRDVIKSPALGEAIKTLAGPLMNSKAPDKTGAPVHTLAAPINPTVNDRTSTPGPVVTPRISQPADQEGLNVNTLDEEILKNYLNQLLALASENHDPTGYAYMIFMNTPDYLLRPVIERVDCVDYLAVINPDVNRYRGWFIELRIELLNYYREELNDTLPPVPPDTDVCSVALT